MKILHTVSAFREARHALPNPLGFVPTMGFLHEAHLALVARARRENRSVAVSIFVNPTQFDREEDLRRYPRDLPRDLALLEEAGVDLVFAPGASELYPPGYTTIVQVRALSTLLEGAHRKGHFDGVATIVSKLFNIVQPDRAYFGQKDAQQVIVIRRMVQDLNFPVEIVAHPTVREPDGLALSSRNVFLEGEDRQQALALSRALQATRESWEAGERDAATLRKRAWDVYAAYPRVRPEYVSLADPETLQELEGEIARGLLSTAAWVGSVRLIDNIVLEESPGSE